METSASLRSPTRPAAGNMSPPQSRRSSRPKRPPPVTPKRFTKFFTPRNPTRPSNAITSRSARQLRDITRAAINRGPVSRTRRKVQVVAFEGIENTDSLITPSSSGTPRKRKHVAITSSSPIAASSPCKRTRVARASHNDIPSSPPPMPVVFEDDEEATTDMEEGEEEEEIRASSADITFCHPIRRIKRSSVSLRVLERSFGHLSTRDADLGNIGWTDLRHKTGNFYSTKSDYCRFTRKNLPFCTASCRTNNLIASASENGSVWLLDTTKSSTMSKPILQIQCHRNAIMDMQFSDDDMSLLTCGGDQSARLTDMRTQQIKSVFQLHSASLKQVRFQPGDNNILASCSRDGLVALWDTRCSPCNKPMSTIVTNPSDGTQDLKSHTAGFYQDPLHLIHKAHPNQPVAVHESDKRAYSIGASVTSMTFMSAERNHLLVTASESTTSLKVWDLRSRYSRHSLAPSTPVSTTCVPKAHLRTRHFGITSLAVDSNASTIYALSRDSTLYAYSTTHLALGQAPEFQPSKALKSRSRTDERPGLGPMYGLRHPEFRAASFFVKCALRPATDDKPELIAAGSTDGAPVVFSTDKRDFANPLPALAEDECPIYEPATVLKNAHHGEITSCSWNNEGNLMSACDDFTVRCWREDAEEARTLRNFAREPGWNMETEHAGWADVEKDFDDFDDE